MSDSAFHSVEAAFATGVLLRLKEIRNEMNDPDLILDPRLYLVNDQVMTPMRSHLDNLLLPLLS